MTIERATGESDIAAAPRVPLPFVECTAAPGQVIELSAFPQIPLWGPYWLGIHCAEAWDVLSIAFGNRETLAACGELPAEYLAFDPDQPFPRHIVPLDAPPLMPGMLAGLRLRNHTALMLVCRAVLWATGEAEAQRQKAEREARLREAVDRVFATERERRESERRGRGFDRTWSLERGWDEPAERARERDRAATRKALEPFEPGDVWESPCDDSD